MCAAYGVMNTKRWPHSVYECLAPGLYWAIISVSVFLVILTVFWLFFELFPDAHGQGKILWYKDVFEGLGVEVVSVKPVDRIFRVVLAVGTANASDLLLSCMSWFLLLEIVSFIRFYAWWRRIKYLFVLLLVRFSVLFLMPSDAFWVLIRFSIRFLVPSGAFWVLVLYERRRSCARPFCLDAATASTDCGAENRPCDVVLSWGGG